jgi:hypothetical protein
MSNPDVSKKQPTDFRRKGLWADKVGFHMLWFEYLALSPSYHLAHIHRTKGLQPKQIAELPADFERVLQVYDDFGDVERTTFFEWWRDRGMELCGHQGDKPKVKRVAVMGGKTRSFERVNDGVEAYCSKDWVAQGRQNTMLVAIPIGLPKSRIAKQLQALLDRVDDGKKNVRPKPPKYPLAGKRQNAEMLFRYLLVLSARAFMQEKALWRIGVRSRVSATYSEVLEEDAKVVRNEGTADRNILAILTSRAILRAKRISENAARGVFPSYKKCEHAVEFDLDDYRERWVSRRRWQKQQKAKDT